MLDVVVFKWTPAKGYRSTHTAEHVNTMRSMVARNYPHPHRFTCITDDPKGIDPRVRVIPLWDDYADMKSPHGEANPSCYRRLRLWSEWARYVIGERILQIDLDMVLVADVSPMWNRREPCVLWADNLNPTTPYNGAMQLQTPGAFPDVIDKFDPKTSPRLAQEKRYWGSDQAWLSYALGPDQARWTAADGALSWRVHCKQNTRAAHRVDTNCTPLLPEGARIVNFHGHEDPWDLARVVPWIAEHYR